MKKKGKEVALCGLNIRLLAYRHVTQPLTLSLTLEHVTYKVLHSRVLGCQKIGGRRHCEKRVWYECNIELSTRLLSNAY